MPRLSCWMLRAALVCLGAGMTIGGLLLAAKAFPVPLGWAWQLLPAHSALLLGGWLIQSTLAMAYWIVPRRAVGERGRPVAAWLGAAALNGGVLIVVGALLVPHATHRAMLTAQISFLVALAAFCIHLWPRIAPVESPSLPNERRT